MYKIMEIENGEVSYYTYGDSPKSYSTKEEALADIQNLQDIEVRFFGDNRIEYRVVDYNE